MIVSILECFGYLASGNKYPIDFSEPFIAVVDEGMRGYMVLRDMLLLFSKISGRLIHNGLEMHKHFKP